MRIPDVEGLKDVHEAAQTSTVSILTPSVPGKNDTAAATTIESPPTIPGQPKSFDRAAAVLSAANGTAGTAGTAPAQKDNAPHHEQQPQIEGSGANGLIERQSTCATGSAFYKCQNGFTGCCSVDPCNPGSSCPDVEATGGEGTKTTSQEGGGEGTTSTDAAVSTGKAKQTETETKSTTTARTSGIATATRTTGIRTATPTGSLVSTTTRRTPRPTAKPAPNCPRANNKLHADSFKIPYRIHCHSDNTASSFDTIAVGTGGYDQCFSSCSQSEKCAGFTFVGSDAGNCYLKAGVLNGTFDASKGSNYVSCAKVDPSDHAGKDPSSMKEPAKKSTGAIVGGVVGGVAFLGLLLLCIALLAKRRRKKIDRRRGTVTHIIHGPIETDMSQPAQPPTQPAPGYGYGYQQVRGYQQPGNQQQGYGHGEVQGHQRQGSTSHDVFTTYGGNVYDPRTHTRQRSIYGAQTWV